MTKLKRIAFIGNQLPRRCGIATFTHDLHFAVGTARPEIDSRIVAMTDAGRVYDYPDSVICEIRENDRGDYLAAASFLNSKRFDVVSLQHEYGIFGGDAGGNIVELLSRLEMPIVTTLHTVLSEPTCTQRDIMDEIIARSSKLVVMAEKGRELLQSVHQVPARNIEVIPHGIPDFPFADSGTAKLRLGFAGKSVILTFGLLAPSKGIEFVIEAMPDIVRACPDAMYVVLGATHPHLVRRDGETYRRRLEKRVLELGLAEHVAFIDQFVDQATLLEYISMCDVYVTPYLGEAQMTSGTLAYSFGLGKAVVSTPYWHATELLGDGRGILVPFSDSAALATEISSLLTNDVRRHAMRKRAYTTGRTMTWARTAEHYLEVFDVTRKPARPRQVTSIAEHRTRYDKLDIPDLKIGHLVSMCDSTGLLQHAVHCIPDRSHGYCVDDNARALLFATAVGGVERDRLPEIMSTQFAAFIQHAWNPDTRRFRNFMSYDRRWLEDAGSEDSHGRTLWALAECARRDINPSRRLWAAALFKTALADVVEFSSLRAWGFVLLALDAYLAQAADDEFCHDLRRTLASKVHTALLSNESERWVWFEDVLAYDNARLPQSLIVTGISTRQPILIQAGIRSLRWLMQVQSSPGGCFRPVGSQSFGIDRQPPRAFDQQPIEAAATISACLAAWRLDGGAEWLNGATRAFQWFLGANDLGTSLIDRDTGSCLDGLHPDRPNGNMGGESVLAYLLSLVEMREFLRIPETIRTTTKAASIDRLEIRAVKVRANSRSSLATSPIHESTNSAPAHRSRKGRRQARQVGDRAARHRSDR